MIQCHGTTQKGERCKLQAVEGYCHHHVSQAPRSPQKSKSSSKSKEKEPNSPKKTQDTGSPKKEQASKKEQPSPKKEQVISKKSSGYIYIYTLEKFFTKEKDWFKVKNLPNGKTKDWTSYNFRSNDYMLLKIGMTSLNVQTRISQWEHKCNHKLIVVNPKTDKVIRPRLIDLFKKMNMKEYRTFQNDGFKVWHSLSEAEKEVHKVLRAKYGRGLVYCKGCLDASVATLRSNELFVNGFNIHVEWFLIPKKDLDSIYTTIDHICTKYR